MPTPINVTITWEEALCAAFAGVRRRIASMAKPNKLQGPNGPPEDIWSAEIEGCAAELAFAKWSKLYWEPVLKNVSLADGDVSGYEIRQTKLASGRLLLQKKDAKNEAPFVLVTGRIPDFQLVGWMRGTSCNDGWWKHDIPRPCYAIPQESLHDMALLFNPQTTSGQLFD